jgi:heme oxygenase
MAQIEGVVEELDRSDAKRQTVRVFPLQNADPEQTLSVLQDIFQKNTTVNNRNQANRTSALGNRSTQQLNQQNSGASGRNTGRSSMGQSNVGR